MLTRISDVQAQHQQVHEWSQVHQVLTAALCVASGTAQLVFTTREHVHGTV